MIDNSIIEAAYLAGFEPSSDTLSLADLFQEAQDFLSATNI